MFFKLLSYFFENLKEAFGIILAIAIAAFLVTLFVELFAEVMLLIFNAVLSVGSTFIYGFAGLIIVIVVLVICIDVVDEYYRIKERE